MIKPVSEVAVGREEVREKAQKLIKRKIPVVSLLAHGASLLASVAVCGILALIVGYILINGIPHLSWQMVFGPYSADNPSMSFAMVTTLLIIGITLLFALPVGIFCAVYLCEYTKSGSRLVKLIRLATETLAGIPSIVYGLFGAMFFGNVLGLGYSVLTGVLTATIMVLPVMIRAAEDAILSVPASYREGSYALGASRLLTIFRIILPAAKDGILSGVILSTGRIIGETAALIFTLGTNAKLPAGLLESSRTLAVHMYINTRDGGEAGRGAAFATGVVLIVIVLVINLLSTYLVKKTKKNEK